MKKFLTIATISLGALSSATFSSSAADLPSTKSAPAAVYAPPIFTWTGFYVGVNGGGGSARFSRQGFYDGNDVSDSKSAGGAFAGIQAGYNYQFSQNFVIGLEADLQLSKFAKTFDCAAGYSGGSCYDNSSYGEHDMRSFGTARVRLGYAMDKMLFFVTGGYAAAHIKYGAYDYLPDNSKSASKTVSGYALGGGVEYAISANWSVKAEYLHLGFSRKTIDPIPSSTPDYVVRVKSSADIARIGINYKF